MRSLSLFTLALFLASCLAVAQDAGVKEQPTQEQNLSSMIELLRSDLKTGRKAVITEAMEFTEKEAEAFWPIYNDYEHERAKQGDAYLQLLKDYAANYDTMTEETAEKLVKRMFTWNSDNAGLLQKYHKKFAKAITAKRAARFVQVENRVNQLVMLQLSSEIPLVK
jgi:hypothetical protein